MQNRGIVSPDEIVITLVFKSLESPRDFGVFLIADTFMQQSGIKLI